MSSLADQVRALANDGIDMRKELWGTTIVITDFSGRQHTFTGATFYGPGSTYSVSGGFYDVQSIGVEIKTADLMADNNFVPEPEMAATALGQDLRIAPDGISPGLYSYRLHLAKRHSPTS